MDPGFAPLPAGYVEAMPHRGPWLPVDAPPADYATVQVLLEDGSTSHATWTGACWWRGGELRPVGWRSMEDQRITA